MQVSTIFHTCQKEFIVAINLSMLSLSFQENEFKKEFSPQLHSKRRFKV